MERLVQHVITTTVGVELNDSNNVGKFTACWRVGQHVVTTRTNVELRGCTNVGKNYNMLKKYDMLENKNNWKNNFF